MQKQSLNIKKQQSFQETPTKQNQFKRVNPITSSQQKFYLLDKFQAKKPHQLDSISKKAKLSNETQELISENCSKQQNQNKHNQYLIHDKQDLTCKICMENYNLNRKMPIIACKNKHVFCLQCIIKSLSHQHMKCPLCRALVQPIQKDEVMFAQLKKMTKNILDFNQMTKIKLKLNKKTSFSRLDHFQIIDKTTYAKIKQSDDWSCLVFQKLPYSLKHTNKSIKTIQKERTSVYWIKFSYKNILQNCISFGLFAFDEFTQTLIDNIGFQSNLFQYFTKKQNKKINDYKLMQINLIVNIGQKNMIWMNNRKEVIAQQSLQVRSIGDVSYQPFIALKQKGDSITL